MTMIPIIPWCADDEKSEGDGYPGDPRPPDDDDHGDDLTGR